MPPPPAPPQAPAVAVEADGDADPGTRQSVSYRLTKDAHLLLSWAVYDAEKRGERIHKEDGAERAVLAYWGPRKDTADGAPNVAVIPDPGPDSDAGKAVRTTSFRLTRKARTLLAWAVYEAETRDARLQKEVAVDTAIRGYWGPAKASSERD